MLGVLAFLGSPWVNLLSGADWKVLPGHVPAAVGGLTPTGAPAGTSPMRLAMGVPLRDAAGLDEFLAQLYDPASTNYHHYLTPEQFADRFGPTKQDYAAVQEFARTNGLTVTGTYGNRLVLDVTGPAAAVERALHITLRTYQHPTEARQFFAPDRDPAVPETLPVADIQGLSDFARPHPRIKQRAVTKVTAHSGSAPDGSGCYFGDDFRTAYAPNTTLTGAGQVVGLLQFDGFYSNDIAAYAKAAGNGRTNIPIQTVLLDGYSGVPTTSGNIEVSLDIEMTMSMAPGLAKIIVFEGGPNGTPNDVLNSMASYSSTVKQLSSSWGWSGGPSTTTDAIFKNMAAGGQSFFNASGDSDAFTTGASSANGVDNSSLDNAPSSSPYITEVGGTTLTMNGAGAAYTSETVWNWGYDSNARAYVGSSGGISSSYSMPAWQTNVSNMAGRGGSATARNIPDVALTADNVYVVYGGSAGGVDDIGGTSCAAPLWAGFMALVNQQAAANGVASPGFINPALYALAAGASYAACFHDVTTGNNTWNSSPNAFYATNGYDLCTGLGTPAGTSLINALVGAQDSLGVSPVAGYAFTGPQSGPFSPVSGVFQLTNLSSAALSWSLINTSAWLQVSATNGTLAAPAAAGVSASPGPAAIALGLGSYAASLEFSNGTSHVAQFLPVTLQISQPLAVSPHKGFSCVGPVGGPFNGAATTFLLTNLGAGAVNWSLINTSAWLTASATGGTLAGGGALSVTVGLASSATTLAAGAYQGSLIFSNPLGVVAVAPFALSVGLPVLQNGDFETGDFTGWTDSGNTSYNSVFDTSVGSSYVHSGSYGAALGPSGSPGYLTQTLTTAGGQNYLLSLWLRNPTGGKPNWFQVWWNGAKVYARTNLTSTAWTNLQFFVTAAGADTLQFAFRNDPDYFGLDDITVAPLATLAFNSTARAAGSFQLSWATTTGVVYQVQYKTNLAQANWLNLGSATTAGTATLTVTDTNAAQSLQRFYRLSAVP